MFPRNVARKAGYIIHIFLELVSGLYFKKQDLQLYVHCHNSGFGYDFLHCWVSELSIGCGGRWNCVALCGYYWCVDPQCCGENYIAKSFVHKRTSPFWLMESSLSPAYKNKKYDCDGTFCKVLARRVALTVTVRCVPIGAPLLLALLLHWLHDLVHITWCCGRVRNWRQNECWSTMYTWAAKLVR
jgi:hypothetical protein